MKHQGRNSSRKSERQQEAKDRNERWSQLSPEQKLQDLDQRLGKDQGARRQREKLKKQINS